jgi:hypothetical protein
MEVLQEVQRRLPQGAMEQGKEPLAWVVRGLGGRLEPELGDLLQQLCRDGLEAQQMLGGNLEGEVMAVLDVLEPVESSNENTTVGWHSLGLDPSKERHFEQPGVTDIHCFSRNFKPKIANFAC